MLQTGLALAPPEQGLLHPPQWLVLILVSVSQPVDTSRSQLPKPDAHEAIPQAPLTQLGVPWATVQMLPQLPQLAVLVAVLVSQPAAAVQSAKPVLQSYPQMPATHLRVLFAGSAHSVHEAPQFSGSVFTEDSQPFAKLSSQLP